MFSCVAALYLLILGGNALYILQGNLGMVVAAAFFGSVFPVNGLLRAPLDAGCAVLALVKKGGDALFYGNVAGGTNFLAEAAAGAAAAYPKALVGGTVPFYAAPV